MIEMKGTYGNFNASHAILFDAMKVFNLQNDLLIPVNRAPTPEEVEFIREKAHVVFVNEIVFGMPNDADLLSEGFYDLVEQAGLNTTSMGTAWNRKKEGEYKKYEDEKLPFTTIKVDMSITAEELAAVYEKHHVTLGARK